MCGMVLGLVEDPLGLLYPSHYHGINGRRKQQDTEDVRRMTAAREADLRAGECPDIHGVLPGADIVDASGYLVNVNG
jgi:hypothetical protein